MSAKINATHFTPEVWHTLKQIEENSQKFNFTKDYKKQLSSISKKIRDAGIRKSETITLPITEEYSQIIYEFLQAYYPTFEAKIDDIKIMWTNKLNNSQGLGWYSFKIIIAFKNNNNPLALNVTAVPNSVARIVYAHVPQLLQKMNN